MKLFRLFLRDFAAIPGCLFRDILPGQIALLVRLFRGRRAK